MKYSYIAVFILAASIMLNKQGKCEVLSVQQEAVDTLEGYLQALKSGHKEKVFAYVNMETIMMFYKNGYNEGTMGVEAAALEGCGKAKAHVKGQRAVVYFSSVMKTCSPYFMEYQKEHWRVDLSTMSRAIRFNRKNEWVMVQKVQHPYMFAFGTKK